MDKSGELLFLVIRLALVRDPLLMACRLRSYSYFSRIQQVGFPLKSLMMMMMMMIMLMMMVKFSRAINHRCIESSNLSI